MIWIFWIFLAFLVNRKRQGLASPRLYHAALAHCKLQAAKHEAWLHARESQKLVKGAGVNDEKNEKGVLTCEMLCELCNYCPPPLSAPGQTPPFKHT